MKTLTQNLPSAFLITALMIGSLSLVGCNGSSSKGAQDREIETKRITGIWKSRVVTESDGKQQERWIYTVFSKPNQDGRGDQIALGGKESLSAIPPTPIRITTTYEDGRIVEFERYGLDGKVGGKDVFEVTDDQDAAAMLTVDNRKAKEIAKQIGGSGGGPDSTKYQIVRVVDESEIQRVERALEEMKSR